MRCLVKIFLRAISKQQLLPQEQTKNGGRGYIKERTEGLDNSSFLRFYATEHITTHPLLLLLPELTDKQVSRSSLISFLMSNTEAQSAIKSFVHRATCNTYCFYMRHRWLDSSFPRPASLWNMHSPTRINCNFKVNCAVINAAVTWLISSLSSEPGGRDLWLLHYSSVILLDLTPSIKYITRQRLTIPSLLIVASLY